MGLPLKEVAGTKLTKANSPSIPSAKTTPTKANSNPISGGIIVNKEKKDAKQLNSNYLASHNNIYSNPQKTNRGQYNSKNYRPDNPAKDKKSFSIGDMAKTTLRNDAAAKKEAKILREKNINDFKNNLDSKYSLLDINDLNSKIAELALKGPQKAPEPSSVIGIYFYFVLAFVLVKDVIDIFVESFELLTDVLVVTIVVSILLWFLSTLADVLSYLMTKLFYKINGISFDLKRWTLFRIAPYILELLPMIGALPLGTIAFICSGLAENKFRKGKAKELQDLYDEQHKIELKYLKERSYTNIAIQSKNIVKNTQINTENTTKTNNPEKKENDWTKMIESSNQNITKQNDQKNT